MAVRLSCVHNLASLSLVACKSTIGVTHACSTPVLRTRTKYPVECGYDSRAFRSTCADEVSVMTRNKVLSYLVVLSALAPTLCRAGVPTSTPIFTISAGNVTMPSSGTVSVPFTLTSVNGFVGSVTVSCIAPTEPAGVRVPFCDQGGPIMAYPLTSDGNATGNMTIVAIQPNPVPLADRSSLARRGEGEGWALAGILMLGIGLRRKSSRRFTRMSLVAGMMVALAGIGVCGCGGPPTLTPGPYLFTLNASSISPTLGPSAITTLTVTVPPGIVTKSSN